MTATPWPESVGIAFKEWEGVCSALADGSQSLILRKGGIEEGPKGFEPEHPWFWLYPTAVHQAEQGLKPEVDSRRRDTAKATVSIQSLAAVEWVDRIDRLETLLRLDPCHVWTEETVAKRFFYKRPGVWVLGVRIFNLPEPAVIPVTPEQLGCKTWVSLDSPLPTARLKPAISDSDFRECMSRIRDKVISPGRDETS